MSSQAVLNVDEPIAGRFRVEKELGRGGMGAVYLAHDEYIDEAVALKVATAGGVAHDEFRLRFEREARIGELLGREDGFVRTYAWGELDDGALYAAMDLVPDAGELDLEEGTLHERLQRLHQVAEIVGRAHAKGVIHRDLKPGNVFVGSDGRPWLGDFGLAKHEGEEANDSALDMTLTHTGVAMGTPYFMPPEQFEDAKTADKRADVYALGVMLYYTLTGTYPYVGVSAAQILSNQLKVRFQSSPQPRARDAVEVAPALDTLCAEATAIDLERRIPSADVFARRLKRCLDRGLAQPKQGQTAMSKRRDSSGQNRATLAPSEPPVVGRALSSPGRAPSDAGRKLGALAVGGAVVLALGGFVFLSLGALTTSTSKAPAVPEVAATGSGPTQAEWEELTKLAEEGDVEAQLGLADLYDDAGDAFEAFRLREEAALDGNTEGMLALGTMYHHGLGTDKSLELALSWYERAADQGSEPAAERAAGIEKLVAREQDVAEARAARDEASERWKQENVYGRVATKQSAQARREARLSQLRRQRRDRLEARALKRRKSRSSRWSSSKARSSKTRSSKARSSKARSSKTRASKTRASKTEADARKAAYDERREKLKQEGLERQERWAKLREQRLKDAEARAAKRKKEAAAKKRRENTITIRGGATHSGGSVEFGKDRKSNRR
jgi:serine/threonine protein kinase